MKDWIRIHERDNVAVALKELKAGERLALEDGRFVTALETVPAGHKIALREIPKGGEVIKYGHRIGLAKELISEGQWVHVHNLRTALGEVLEYAYEPAKVPGDDGKAGSDGIVGDAGKAECNGIAEDDGKARCNGIADGGGKPGGAAEQASFQGFLRGDGKVGVRNEIWIVPTVGCVNSIATALARKANAYLHGSVEEVIAFPHPYGCSQMGEDQEHTREILADLILHPNAGGVLVLGLGCENSGVATLKPYLGAYDEKRVRFLVCQEVEDEMAAGEEILKELIDQAATDQRTTLPASKLIVGMKCGGSDGFSGITANPLVGRFSDLLVGMGGTTILTEVPEMFGAEEILMNRCENRELFDKTVCLINDFKRYYTENHQTIYENPSPGNKQGGISTLEDKSLGCTQKSGSAPVRGVLAYGKRVETPGLNLLSAPGNDLVAGTALAASGAQIILFTTGRGTPFASPVPTIKISSNSSLAMKKKSWIDFDAGVVLTDDAPAQLGERLFSYVLEVASGRKVRSEEAGFHDMAIFKQGVTL